MKKAVKTTFAIISAMMLLLSGCGKNGAPASANQPDADFTGINVIFDLKIDENTGVVLESIADVFSEPDVRSERVTQVICNQPVSILEEGGEWLLINTADGSRGWIRAKYITKNIASIYGRTYSHEIVITSKEKSIYSHASGGVTLLEAAMGSVFLAFNEDDGAYEVYLPGNRTGWVSGSGIIHINKEDEISVTTGHDFATSALKFKGVSYLYNGVGFLGVDSAGLNYICAFVNGIKLPRTLEEQAEYGEKVDIENKRMGDILFFHEPKSEDKAVFSAIVVDGGGDSLIYCNSSVGYVKTGTLSDFDSQGYIIKARRIF